MQLDNNEVFRTISKTFGSHVEVIQHFKEKNTKNTVYLSKENIQALWEETCRQEYIDEMCDELYRQECEELTFI